MPARAKRRANQKTSLWKQAGDAVQFICGVCGILGLLVSWLQYQSPGAAALAPSELALGMGSFELSRESVNRIYFGTTISDKGAAYLVSLPLIVTNKGRGSLERVTVSSIFPELLQHTVLEMVTERLEGQRRKFVQYSSDSQVIDGRSIHTARFGPLDPEDHVGLTLPMPFKRSEMTVPVTVGNASLNAYVRYAFQVNFEIQAINGPKYFYRTEICMLAAADKEELRLQVETYESESMRKDRAEWPWWKRWFAQQQKTVLRGFGQPKLMVESGGAKVYEIPVSALSQDLFSRPAPGRFVLPLVSLLLVGVGFRIIWVRWRRSRI